MLLIATVILNESFRRSEESALRDSSSLLGLRMTKLIPVMLSRAKHLHFNLPDMDTWLRSFDKLRHR